MKPAFTDKTPPAFAPYLFPAEPHLFYPTIEELLLLFLGKIRVTLKHGIIMYLKNMT